MKHLFIAFTWLVAPPVLANPADQPNGAVVRPVFYTVNFNVEGYSLVNNPTTPPQMTTLPKVYMENSLSPYITKSPSVSPKEMLTKLTKQIDAKVEAKNKPATNPTATP